MEDEQCAKKPKLDEIPIISEGKAQILIMTQNVFYNPVQEFNRDLSVAVLTIFAKDRWNEKLQKCKLEKEKNNETNTLHNIEINTESQKGITILEALSATGLRSIRYAKEIENVQQIVANDISVKAVESIKRNVLHNNVENLVIPSQEDAMLLMYQHRRDRFDAVDLDPYGCPSMYLDGAVQCVSDGGILLITATDMAILAGNGPETCYYKYGAISCAPVVDQLCEHCCHWHHMGGPIWLGPLHDQAFVSQILCNLNSMELGTLKRMKGVLTMIHEELDVPLYYNLNRLMSIVKCQVPPMLVFRSALLNAGYKVSYSHANKVSIKTDAPNNIIWDIVRIWEKKHPVKKEKLAVNSPAERILNALSTTDISLDIHPLANPISRQKHLSRFQKNPTVNWGPGVRARTRVDFKNKMEDLKKMRNQNKNSKNRSAKQSVVLKLND